MDPKMIDLIAPRHFIFYDNDGEDSQVPYLPCRLQLLVPKVAYLT